jgi:CBS-domain-containing membrane protein
LLRKDILIAPVCEGALITILALAAWIAHNPLVFASLGPTAYELVETPERPTARPYNIVAGHLLGVLSAFLALFLTHADRVPPLNGGGIALPRVWAAGIAAALTVLATLLARATQPAAVATALLVALGNMQHWRDGFFIMAAVLLITALGTPIRKLRLKALGKSDVLRMAREQRG